MKGFSWRSDDLRLRLSALIDLMTLLLMLLLLLLLVVGLVVLGEVRGAQHDEGVQAGHGGGAHWSWWWWWWRWRWVVWSRTEMEQLVMRLMRLVRLVGEEMFVVLDSAVAVTVTGAVNCIDHHRSGDLPRLPAVLSRQESLQEEDLGGEEGCEGPPRSPVSSS